MFGDCLLSLHGKKNVENTRLKNLLPCFLVSLWLRQNRESGFLIFCGSSTTGIAANLLRRRFLGIDQEKDYLEISKHRREELDNSHIVYEYRSKIKDIKLMNSQCPYVVNDDIDVSYRDLPF